MAEATTVVDPNATAPEDETATAVATVPTSGPMAILYRLTGGQSLRQVLPAVGAIVISIIGLVFFVVFAAARAHDTLCLAAGR